MAWTIGKFIPRSIQRKIYKLPIMLISRKLAPEREFAWCKNSVALDDFIFGISDLDISILLVDGEDQKKTKNLLSHLVLLKRLFPFMGETSIYFESDFSWLRTLINPAELRRDPELLKRMSFYGSLKELTINQKRAFAIHWLMSDYKKMERDFSQRKAKIKRFSGLLGWGKLDQCSNYEDFLGTFLVYLFKEKRDRKVFQDLWQKTSILLERNDHQRLLKFYRDYKERAFMMTYFPAVWLGLSVELGLISEELLLIEEMSQEHRNKKGEKSVLEEMLAWELWGLYTQHLFHADSIALTIHLGHLKKVAIALGNQKIVDAFAYLESSHSKNLISGELCVS